MVGYTLNDVKKRLKKRNLKKYLKAGTVSPPTSEEKVQLQISHRGISLGFLVALTESFELQNLDTATVVKQFIAPVTDDTIEPSRFSELGCFRQYFGEADTFISHCWKGKWGDLVAACLDGGYYLSRIVWIDIFAVTQHPNMKALQDDLNALQSVIAGVRQGTTLVWNPRLQIDSDSNPVLRAWCLYEIHTTVLKENALVIKMGEASVNSQGYKYNVSSSNSNSRTNKSNGSHNASENKGFDFIPETDENVVTELVFSIDIRRAKATMPEDLERIHAMIEEQGGLDELNTSVRTAVYNNWRIMQIPAVQYALRGSKTKVTQFLRNFDASASTGTGTYTYGGDPGGSLLHDLVHGNYCIAAQLAIDCGAAINKQTDKGNTPLMFAAEGGRLTMCNTLIQNGAAVDLQNSKKETALHLAAKYGRVDVVKLLLAAGADTTILDRGDYTPAGLAKLDKMPGCKEVLNLLDPEGFSLVSEEGDYQCLGFDGRALVATLKRMFPQN